MKIAILILLIYSIFGVHVSIPICKFRNYNIKISSSNFCVLIATILYSITIF